MHVCLIVILTQVYFFYKFIFLPPYFPIDHPTKYFCPINHLNLIVLLFFTKLNFKRKFLKPII